MSHNQRPSRDCERMRDLLSPRRGRCPSPTALTSFMRRITDISDGIHGVYVGQEWAHGQSGSAVRIAMVTNYLLRLQVYGYPTLN
eukprot:9494018-Pyramimonas_sp.AAC.1